MRQLKSENENRVLNNLYEERQPNTYTKVNHKTDHNV